MVTAPTWLKKGKNYKDRADDILKWTIEHEEQFKLIISDILPQHIREGKSYSDLIEAFKAELREQQFYGADGRAVDAAFYELVVDDMDAFVASAVGKTEDELQEELGGGQERAAKAALSAFGSESEIDGAPAWEKPLASRSKKERDEVYNEWREPVEQGLEEYYSTAAQLEREKASGNIKSFTLYKRAYLPSEHFGGEEYSELSLDNPDVQKIDEELREKQK